MNTIQKVVLVITTTIILVADVQAGRWLSRDPIDEGEGFVERDPVSQDEFVPQHRNEPNVYVFVRNDAMNTIDPFGLWATEVHHAIVEDWLKDPKYKSYRWRCCNIPVRELLKEGSDEIDGDIGFFTFVNPWFYGAQSSANAYQHAMKSPKQTVAQAQALYNQFLNDHIQQAKNLAAKAKTRQSGAGWDCAFMHAAVRELGKSFHAYSDGLSPSHKGFQTWWGPVDGVAAFGKYGYYGFAKAHSEGETPQVYKDMKDPVVKSVEGQFQGTLDELLKE